VFPTVASAADLAPKSTGKKDGINKKTPLKITSDQMKSYKKRNLVSFIGHVIAYKDDMTIHADQIDVYSNTTQKEMEKIVATGNVKLYKEDMEGTCEQGIYEEYEKKLTLIGNAVVIKKDNVIKGSKIVYLLEEESVLAEGDIKKRVEVTIYPDQLETEKNKPN
jgi:lipopolysaccharide transport protein LptA